MAQPSDTRARELAGEGADVIGGSISSCSLGLSTRTSQGGAGPCCSTQLPAWATARRARSLMGSAPSTASSASRFQVSDSGRSAASRWFPRRGRWVDYQVKPRGAWLPSRERLAGPLRPWVPGSPSLRRTGSPGSSLYNDTSAFRPPRARGVGDRTSVRLPPAGARGR